MSDDPVAARALKEEGQRLAGAFSCDGQDRHHLTLPVRQATASGLAGVTLIALDLLLHAYGRGLGVGIGLLLVPLFAWLFAQWVDGPVLYYRRWGRLHQLTLSSVTAVTVGNSRATRRMLLLAAPGLAKPVRVSVQSRGFVMSTAAREHLHGWLSTPQVQWSAQAAALLDPEGQSTSGTRGRRRLIAGLLGLALPLAGVGVGLWIVYEHGQDLAIPGAPGYSTFTGPLGKPLPVGRPWGRPCQPVRFAVEEHVPDWVYDQVDAVVTAARRDGIDVALETRQFFWSPGTLYYMDGQTTASTVRIGIFADDGTPPELSNGQPEHIGFGWDAILDPDGHNEDLTQADGMLWMQTLGANAKAVRRSVRQLIAMTQGIMSTSRRSSGIARDSNIDRFTTADIAAMDRMSGCAAGGAQFPASR